jgi:histidyl-tRNA synthetase
MGSIGGGGRYDDLTFFGLKVVGENFFSVWIDLSSGERIRSFQNSYDHN